MKPTSEKHAPTRILMRAAPSKGRWELWNDWITFAACTFALAGGDQPEARAEEMRQIVERYKPEEIAELDRAFSAYIDEIDGEPFQDYLGQLYMEMDFGQSEIGQFFTPFHLARFMSSLTEKSLGAEIEENGWTSVYDPACGGGATLIAAAGEIHKAGYNPQATAWFEGQDLSRLTALMCYVQLCALGLPGRVRIGDTLRMTEQDCFTTPAGMQPLWRWRVP